MSQKMSKHAADRAEWYDRNDKLPDRPDAPEIRISRQAKGQLSEGYTKLSMPEAREQGHSQTKSERSTSGPKWPGPGKKLSHDSSASESFLRQRRNVESSK